MADQIRITIFVLIIGIIIGITSGYGLGYLNYQPELTARNDQIAQLEVELTNIYTQLQSNLTQLRNELSSLTTQFQQATANYSLTNLQFAASAIPFNFTSRDQTSTDSTIWTTIPGASLTINTPRNASLIILFSSEVAMNNASYQIGFRIALDTDIHLPNDIGIYHFPVQDYHFDASTFNFYALNTTAGIHTIDLQWTVTGSTGFLRNLNLIAFALPS
jgi:hypothetical protein